MSIAKNVRQKTLVPSLKWYRKIEVSGRGPKLNLELISHRTSCQLPALVSTVTEKCEYRRIAQ